VAGCNAATSPATSEQAAEAPQLAGDGPWDVVATTGPVAELVRTIGAERVVVAALMGPGVDPHRYRPTLGDSRRLADADLIVFNGLHLEGRMTEMFERMSARRPTVAVTAGLERADDSRLRHPPETPSAHDPHVWHDPLLWADCGRELAARLAQWDPAHAAAYARRAEEFAERMRALDGYCRAQLARIPPERRVLVTAHDAFAYFGAAYGLEVASLKGISTEEEKDPRRQEEVRKLILARRLPAVFVESAVAPRTVESLVEPCRAAGHDLRIGGELFADALGPEESPAATYEGMIRCNVDTIVAALAGDARAEAP
jgi:manganese/zinc/iron transport system substrate-binding protein